MAGPRNTKQESKRPSDYTEKKKRQTKSTAPKEETNELSKALARKGAKHTAAVASEEEQELDSVEAKKRRKAADRAAAATVEAAAAAVAARPD